MKRLMLLPFVPRLRRDRRTVQVGLNPGRSAIIEADHPSCRVLELLDGTRSEAVIRRESAQLGLPDRDTGRLLDTLHGLGLLLESDALLPPRLTPSVRRRLEPEATALALRPAPGPANPAQLLARRRRARVVVAGRSRLTAPIAALLAAAGVGHVHPTAGGTVTGTDQLVGGILPTDARRPVRRAAVEAVLRAAPDTDTRVIPEVSADLLILVGSPRPAPATLFGHVLRRVAHLPVWVRDGTVVIGPLVRPGRTSCLHCVDLHRRDRDAHWPVLAAQLCTNPDPAEPGETIVLAMGAALAAGQALAQLDGDDPASLAGTLEVSSPGAVRRRSWPAHPGCGCLDRRRTAAAPGRSA